MPSICQNGCKTYVIYVMGDGRKLCPRCYDEEREEEKAKVKPWEHKKKKR